jgi:aspartate racemase
MSRGERPSLGVIGGLGPLAGADVFFKLVRAAGHVGGQRSLVFEQRPLNEEEIVGQAEARATARKFYVFDLIREFESRGIDRVLLPCFISHSFLDELQPEIRLHVVNLMEAISEHVKRRFPEARRIGILTSDHVKEKQLFEQYFPPSSFELVYPESEIQGDCLMPAIYGPQGIKGGQLTSRAVELVERSCLNLEEQEVDLILPGFTEIPLVIDSLGPRRVPIVDVNSAYAQHALMCGDSTSERCFRLGVVGGVGPAATVDFLDKIVRFTPAQSDQDHIKLLVEHNPQIPDRTDGILGGGADPTIALYSTCKKLEQSGADAIAIPCNTAHAYLGAIQPHLLIPIVNMLQETIEHLRVRHPDSRIVGLLATNGTLASSVYHHAAQVAGIDLLEPDEKHQRLVMSSIYGKKGVKAGHFSGQCRDELQAALEHLVLRGAEAVILGCTELPLVFPEQESFEVAGHTVPLLDPTAILARKCVALAIPPTPKTPD